MKGLRVQEEQEEFPLPAMDLYAETGAKMLPEPTTVLASSVVETCRL